jgi:hypothetical protein
MKTALALIAALGFSVTAAAASCPFSSNISASVDRELVVASIATDQTVKVEEEAKASPEETVTETAE